MFKKFCKTAAFLACAAGLAVAQAPAPVASIKAPGVTRIAENSTATAKLTVTIQPGFHIQSDHPKSDFLIPSTLKLTPADGISVVRVTWPQPQEHKFSFSADPLSVFEGTVPVTVRLKESGAQHVGSHVLKGTFRYQACSDQLCRPPVTVPVSLTVDVVAPHHG